MRFAEGLLLAGALLIAEPPRAAQAAPPTLQQRVSTVLAEAGPGTRFGLVVATMEGEELVALLPDQRFMPASNTKIFTTAAAFDLLGDVNSPDVGSGALVRLQPGRRGAPDVVLEGRGDARLSSAPDCVVDCLAALADAVAARTRRVRNVIANDRFYPDERWSQGMSWNNIVSSSGTAIGALTIDDNEVPMRVTSAAVGVRPNVTLAPYFTLDNQATTVADAPTALEVERLPGSKVVRLTGTVKAGETDKLLRLGVDDPADYAAWRLRTLLGERGVRVTGTIRAVHRTDGKTFAAPAGEPLAKLTPAPVLNDILVINKVSQNLHAELLLRRLGKVRADGSAKDGLAVVTSMLAKAGVPPLSVQLSDGSGMSTYNRTSPRAMVTLLRWIARQPWGERFRATLPVGGVDGTLARRFATGPLRGRIFAKTGSLNATNALAGYLLTRSGRMLVFAFYANDVPDEVKAAPTMDRALEAVAEAL